MNVYDVLLNMQSNCLIFKLNRYNYFDAFKTFIIFSKTLFDFRFTLNFVFIIFIDLSN